jgi:hypothetical protein
MKLNKIARVLLLAAAYAGITTSSWAVAHAVSGHPGDHDEARQVRHVGHSRESEQFGILPSTWVSPLGYRGPPYDGG